MADIALVHLPAREVTLTDGSVLRITAMADRRGLPTDDCLRVATVLAERRPRELWALRLPLYDRAALQ